MLGFESDAQAFCWLETYVKDPCIDNYRFAYLDDKVAMEKYQDKVNRGCCGSVDIQITICGKEATIGCNYSH